MWWDNWRDVVENIYIPFSLHPQFPLLPPHLPYSFLFSSFVALPGVWQGWGMLKPMCTLEPIFPKSHCCSVSSLGKGTSSQLSFHPGECFYTGATGLTSSVENHHNSNLLFWFPGVRIWKCTERSFIFLWPCYQGGEMIMISLNQSGVAVMKSGSSGLYVQCSKGN